MNLTNLPSSELIALLESPDSASRDAAARKLFRIGRDNAERAIAAWRANPEIGALISNRATVGIAVTRERFAKIRALLGEPRLADVPPDQDAEEFEWAVDSATHLDVLTTRASDKEGAIAKFLGKFGEGIQQVELLTRNIDEVTLLLASKLNVFSIYPATRNGADGTRVNFFLAGIPTKGKILIELVESKR